MNAKRKYEIEIRGKLSKQDFEKIVDVMNKDGRLIDHYSRLSVDLSPGFNPITYSWNTESNFDLRIKKSGKSEKISIKIGQFHSKKRGETEVNIKEGEFLNAVELLEILGFNQGMVYFWESWEFDYHDFEVKLSKYTNDYFTWEIESDNPKLDPHNLAKLLNLKPYTKKEYGIAIDWENRNIHKLYKRNQVRSFLKSM